ncbi:glycosyl-4,4'-diaponeurosporenoate acyltransferase [soil metagenome]
MLIHLSDEIAVLVSIAAWIVIGVATGLAGHLMPLRWLDHDNWLTRPRRFEARGRIYQRVFRIRAWKDRVPELGGLFRGGFSKRHLIDRSTPQLERFEAETRRAELVHWANLDAGPLFLIWCPPWIGAVMIVFGVVAHLPFIMIQRYNRARLARLLDRRARRSLQP